MSLTTHYTFLTMELEGASAARELVEKLRQRAADLPFETVDDIIERKGEAASFAPLDGYDPCLWMLIQCGDLALREHFMPRHVIGFQTRPAQGAEPACFGLARYDKWPDYGDDEKLHENVWAWTGWCSTRHAANPKFGGWNNFARGFLSIISMLDFAVDLGILHHVRDNYQYWEERNWRVTIEKLAENLMLSAAFSGALSDALDDTAYTLHDAIKDFPNFEHLEHEGRKIFEER